MTNQEFKNKEELKKLDAQIPTEIIVQSSYDSKVIIEDILKKSIKLKVKIKQLEDKLEILEQEKLNINYALKCLNEIVVDNGNSLVDSETTDDHRY